MRVPLADFKFLPRLESGKINVFVMKQDLEVTGRSPGENTFEAGSGPE